MEADRSYEGEMSSAIVTLTQSAKFHSTTANVIRLLLSAILEGHVFFLPSTIHSNRLRNSTRYNVPSVGMSRYRLAVLRIRRSYPKVS